MGSDVIRTEEDCDFPPSHFAKKGQPCCSIWGKTEIELIALAYVQALANDDDTWKELSREQVYRLLSEKQQRPVHGYLTKDFYSHWFEAVRKQITDSDGALQVGGFWS